MYRRPSCQTLSKEMCIRDRGIKDSKRREHPKLPEMVKSLRVDRLIGGVGEGDTAKGEVSQKKTVSTQQIEQTGGDVLQIKIADGESTVNGERVVDDGKHKDKGTSPIGRDEIASPIGIHDAKSPQPPTLELVIGRKEVRTKEASATSESRLTLYTAHDVEISIRSQSHISLTTTRRDAGGKETSETVDVDTTVASDRQAVVSEYIIPPTPELVKEKKREETVIFSGKKSVYTYDTQEIGSPAFESPLTDESVSHHLSLIHI